MGAIEGKILEAVRLARERGATWQDIASATGYASKQAAQQRWGAFLD